MKPIREWWAEAFVVVFVIAIFAWLLLDPSLRRLSPVEIRRRIEDLEARVEALEKRR